MKYTIMGFNQVKAVELNLDCNDLLILSYFSDFRDTEAMVSEEFNGKRYYWLRYDALIANLPILGLKSKDALRRRLKKLQNAKVLCHYCKKTKEGTYSFYGVDENFITLKCTRFESSVGSESGKPANSTTRPESSVGTRLKSSTGTTQKSDRVRLKSSTGTTQKSDQKINLLKDYSIKNTIPLENKEQSSTSSSFSLKGVREIIYSSLKQVSPEDIAYETWFKDTEIIECSDKVIIKGSSFNIKHMPSKYISIVKNALDKPIELIEVEE